MILLVLRLAVASLFAVSGFMKLMEPYQNFLTVIQSYQVMSGWQAEAAARIFPWIELVFGVLLFLGLWFRISLYSLWLLNTALIGIVTSAIWRKLPLHECGCFGEAISLTPGQVLLLDLSLFVLFAILARYAGSRPRFSLDEYFDKGRA